MQIMHFIAAHDRFRSQVRKIAMRLLLFEDDPMIGESMEEGLRTVHALMDRPGQGLT
jgi:hypothetical protein